MRRRVLPLLSVALIVALAAPIAARAQLSRSKSPVDISSDNAVEDPETCESSFTGNVEAMQGEARLRADRIISFAEKLPKKCGDTVRFEAHGHLYYFAPAQRRVRGDDAVYTAADDHLTITGDVVAVDGQNVQQSTRLSINMRTGSAQSDAAGPGPHRRVRTVIFPKGSDTGAARGPGN